MDINDSEKNNKYIDENEQLNVDINEPTVCPLETNTSLTTNNITNTVEADPIELSFIIEENYGLRPCFVELSRCDNIWKTLQLIRDLQDDGIPERSDNDDDNNDDKNDDDNDDDDNDDDNDNNEDTDKHDEDEPTSSINDNESYSSSTQANIMTPYIKYQPVLNNGNTALDFKFSVMSTRLLYQCHECGKQYSHRSTLREHSERIHNIILPIMRKRSENTNNDTSKNVQAKFNNDIQDNSDVNSVELSSVTNENNSNNLQDDGALLDNISDAQLSDRESTTVINKIYICHYCNRQYKDKYYFNYHLKTAHDASIKGIRPYKKRSNNNINNSNNNNSANEQGTSKKARRIQQSEQSRDLNVHQCSTCGKHFYDKVRLARHQRKVHGIFQRNPVTRRFQSNKSNFKNKIGTHHSLIKSSNITASLLGQMNQSGHQRKVNPCAFCDKIYVDRQAWKTHLTKVHDVKFEKMNKVPKGLTGPLLCKECGRRYLSGRGLVDHLFTVHGQRLQHECETCGLKFPNSDSLIKHALEIHRIMLIQRIIGRQKARPYKCHVCFTHYGKKGNLEWHMMDAHGKKNVDGLRAQQPQNNTSATTNQSTMRRRSIPSQNLRRGLRDKTRINYNEATESRSVEKLLLGDLLLNKENVETTEKIDGGNVVICFLCQRRCIKIHRHFTEYHKIRHPEALIAQCKPLSSSSEINDSEMNVKNEVPTNTEKSVKNTYLHRKVQRARRGIDPNRLFMKITTNTGHKYYKCKICPNYVNEKYEILRKHEKIHKRQKVPLPLDKNEIDNHEENINSRKRKRVSMDNRKIQRPRLSDSIAHTRTTRATTKLKETREFRCSVCERLFRNAEILSSHKISCITYHADNSLMNDTSDTRESSDRDSGIGISITIKKKNNSYEIVGRDSNEEKKLPNSDVKNNDNFKINDSVCDNSSDAFAIMTNDKKNDSEMSFSYSKDHRVLKIQKVEDIDVEIDLDSISNSPINFGCGNDQEVTSSVDNIMRQVPSLKQLCENVLEEAKKEDTLPFKCRVCSKRWSSQASCNSHMRVHSKST